MVVLLCYYLYWIVLIYGEKHLVVARVESASQVWRKVASLLVISCLGAIGAVFVNQPSEAQEASIDFSKPRIVISKSQQKLEFFRNGSAPKTYRICLGLNPIGPKRLQGDSKTPEGDYFVCYKSNASRFHRFLGISYPGIQDAQAAFEAGLICLDDRDAIIDRVRKGESPPWHTPLGGWVGIHGYPSSTYEQKWALLLYPKPHNWTDGCIALWNFEIEELFNAVPLKTPVRINP